MAKRNKRSYPVFTGLGEFRKDYNILLRRGDEIKRLVSFTMMTDGSLIVFNQAPHDGKHYATNRIPARKGKHIFKLKDMEQVEYGAESVPGKRTFHMSGVVNFENMRRGVRTSLKTMDITQPLVTFIHPQVSELLSLTREVNNRDVVFEYNDWPEAVHPMIKVYLSPPGDGNIIQKYMEDGVILGAVELAYLGDKIRHASKQLHVQVTLEPGPESKSPRRANQIVILDNDQLIPLELKPKRNRA